MAKGLCFDTMCMRVVSKIVVLQMSEDTLRYIQIALGTSDPCYWGFPTILNDTDMFSV